MQPARNTTRIVYFIATGLFFTVFIVSILLSVLDPQGTIDEYRKLSFPTWLLIPQTLAKALGLLAISQRRWPVLKDFAFAGFLYNLLLALGAHIAVRDVNVVLAIIGLAAWVFAFTMDRIYIPRAGGQSVGA